MKESGCQKYIAIKPTSSVWPNFNQEEPSVCKTAKHTLRLMNIDHVFVFTNNPSQIANSLIKLGLVEGSPNRHAGQGTACRRFFFHNFYLELPWVVDEEEARSSDMARANLWERSNPDKSGHCPFGVCFRRDKKDATGSVLFSEAWRYYSPFLPEGQFANIADTRHPHEPLLFEMPFFNLAPADYPDSKQEPLSHPAGLKELTRITIHLPNVSTGISESLLQAIRKGDLEVLDSRHYHMELEFDGGRSQKSQSFDPSAPLTITW